MSAVTWLAEPVGQIAPNKCDHPELVDQLVKSQSIRALDVVLIGPLMLWAAFKLPRGTASALLGFSGLATIVFNGVNYWRVKKAHEACVSAGELL